VDQQAQATADAHYIMRMTRGTPDAPRAA